MILRTKNTINIVLLNYINMSAQQIKLLSSNLLCLLLLLPGVISAQSKNTSVPIIKETSEPRGWIIQTNSSAYQLVVGSDNRVKAAFYGNVEQAAFEDRQSRWFTGIDEVPVRGAYPNKIPAIEVVFKDNVRDADLTFVSGDIVEVEGRKALRIVQKDRYYPLEITSYIRVLPEYDILEKWIVAKNTGKKDDIKVENLQSGSLVLPANNYTLTHMTGTHAHEFQMRETELTEGVKTLEAADFKSFKNPPWYMVRPKGEGASLSGDTWFGSIQYTGSWKMSFDKSYEGNVQIVGGINFWDTHWILKPGESFETPRFVSGFTSRGSEGAAQSLREYTRETLLPVSHRDELRPVLYNSWYATKFNVNEEQQLKLARQAKDLGVEMFVIDDGWFKGRVNATAGLGDWDVDPKKFPNGLGPMIKKINDMGMQFGIWIEPEMVNPNSDLYRKHPDWAFQFPNRTKTLGRNQLMLNLANEEVYDFLLAQFSKLFRENNIKYIKWDHNRTLAEPGWPAAPPEMQREVRIRYVRNLYRLIDNLRRQFPDVWFEDCSGGAGRADLGMLSRMDVAWASDNTEPLDRLFIHYGYLNLFPANTMISWVTQQHLLSHQPLSLDFYFDVSMAGVLGIGTDISKWTEEEKALAKRKIEQYKQIRPIVQNGMLYRLVSPLSGNKCAFQYVAENTGSVVFCYNMAEYISGRMGDDPANLFKLEGLKTDQDYQLEFFGVPAAKQPKTIYKGGFLMNIGVAWPVKGANKSVIVSVKPVSR